MTNPTIENYLIQFQNILTLLIKRSSETAFFPLISFYKSQLEIQINHMIKKTEDSQESSENLLIMATTMDNFLTNTLDAEIKKLKHENKSLYSDYNRYRFKNKKQDNSSPEYIGKANFGITQALNLPYLSSRSFLIKNTGNTALTFCLSENFKNLEGTKIILNPNETVLRSSGVMNANGKANKLYALNNEQKMGHYKIWVF